MPYKNSENTKRELSSSLKSLLKEKELSKITISDITDHCHMNRNSFYYHFEDINGILKWTLEQEPLVIVSSVDPSNFKKTLEDTISYVEHNQFILNCVFDSFGREQLKRYFYSNIYQAIETMVNDKKEENGDERYRQFVCERLTEMAGSTLLEYFRDRGRNYSKKETIEYLTRLIESNKHWMESKR